MNWEGEEERPPINPDSAGKDHLFSLQRFLVRLAGPLVEHKPPSEKTTKRVERFRAICRALVVDEKIDAFNRTGLATAEEQQYFLDCFTGHLHQFLVSLPDTSTNQNAAQGTKLKETLDYLVPRYKVSPINNPNLDVRLPHLARHLSLVVVQQLIENGQLNPFTKKVIQVVEKGNISPESLTSFLPPLKSSFDHVLSRYRIGAERSSP